MKITPFIDNWGHEKEKKNSWCGIMIARWLEQTALGDSHFISKSCESRKHVKHLIRYADTSIYFNFIVKMLQKRKEYLYTVKIVST
mgnify:CR=1 FL=1